MENPQILWGTKTYLVGTMQNVPDSVGTSWRKKATKVLTNMGIVVYDPYCKPFIKDVQESGNALQKNLVLRSKGSFSILAKRMKEIRSYDLNLVDRSDFIIANIDPKIPSWGSSEEIFTANRMKKPIFLSIKGGLQACPLWLFGVIPYKYIYNSVDDILAMIETINSGKTKIDSDRWRLLRKEFR